MERGAGAGAGRGYIFGQAMSSTSRSFCSEKALTSWGGGGGGQSPSDLLLNILPLLVFPQHALSNLSS